MHKLIHMKRTFMFQLATMLLFMVTTPVSAQYYLNVFQKDGAVVDFEISDLDSITVTQKKVASIVLSDTVLSMQGGQAVTIVATPLDKHGKAMDATVNWRTSNKTVARVENGKVTAVAAGTCTITAYIDAIQATCAVTVTPGVASGFENGYEYVDLGLSVKWAKYNVGADKPEGYGGYYSWGETESKDTYSWETYTLTTGQDSKLTRYCNDAEYGYEGFTDNKLTLTPDDDVAHVKWGGSWRMPTREELEELLNDCTWQYTSLEGVKGWQVSGKKAGYEGRSIFLPAAGYNGGSMAGIYGRYWGSSIGNSRPDQAVWLSFYGPMMLKVSDDYRVNGQSVRPVCP